MIYLNQSDRMPPSRAVILRLFFLVLFICIVFDLLVSRDFILLHAPLSDDLSMIAFSRSWSWDWFTKGLADYFIVYPEYYGPQSNFIRPVSNFAYWVFSAAIERDAPFLANQIQLVLLNFGSHAAISAIVAVIIHRLNSSWQMTIFASLACIFIPTFWTTPTPSYSSFVFDELAVLFCLVALLAVSGRRLLIMSSFLGLALLTKEIAFPIVAAFGSVFLLQRQWKAVFGCLVAVAIWTTLRINGFGLHAEGVYVFTSESSSYISFLIEKLRNIFTLPFGPVFFEDIFDRQNNLTFVRSALLLVLNSCIYLIFVYLLVRIRPLHIWRHFRHQKKSEKIELRGRIIAIASTVSVISFMFDAYVGANYRYAFNFLPFLFIAVAGIDGLPKLQRILFMIFASGSLVASAPSIVRLQTDFKFESFRYDAIGKLFSALRSHQASSRIVILNDFVLGFANPKAMEILVPFAGEIMRGTSLYLDGCAVEDIRKIETTISRSNSDLTIATNLSTCGQFTFESSPKIGNFVSGTQIARNDVIHYEFIANTINPTSNMPGTQWDRRNLASVIRNSDVLYFDFEQNDWVFISWKP